MVYDVVKNMLANVSDLASIAKAVGKADAKAMAVETGVPMHKGAAKFYKEQGVL